MTGPNHTNSACVSEILAGNEKRFKAIDLADELLDVLYYLFPERDKDGNNLSDRLKKILDEPMNTLKSDLKSSEQQMLNIWEISNAS